MTLAKGARVEPLASRTHQIEFAAECHRVEIGIQRGNVGYRHIAQTAGGAGIAVKKAHAARLHVHGADEIAPAPDRPCDRGSVERQRFFDLVDQVERIAAFAVHLVDECDDRNVAQPAHLEKLARARFDAFGAVDHHDRRVDRRKGPIGVLRKILVARRIEQIEYASAVFERHHRGHDGYAALAFDRHPV